MATLMRLILVFAIFLAVARADIHDTALGQLADSLGPGEYAQLPSPTLNALPLYYSQFEWANSAVWDGSQISLLAGTGSCCEYPGYFRRVVYNATTDTWSITAPLWTGTGHAYDSNAYDPASGTYYFARGTTGNAAILSSPDGATWTALPPVPFAGQVISAGLAWFPEADAGEGALIYVGTTNQVAAYYDDEWHVVPCPGCPSWGPYNTTAEYNPIHEAVWLGGNAINYRLDPNLTLTRLPDAPVTMSTGGAYHATDPVSGKHLVTRISDRTWWEYDLGVDVWTQRTDWTNIPAVSAAHRVFQVAVPELGVIVYVSHYYTSRKVFVVKLDGNPPEPPPPPPGPECIPVEYIAEPPLDFCPS